MATPERPRIVAICNQKGGCGKTTTVINVSAGLAAMGQRVLVIDLDSQCNATTGLGVTLNDVEKSTFDMLMEPKAEIMEDVILETAYPNLHVAPGSIELSEFESRAANEIGRENKLKKAVQILSAHYDFILIDTPPSLGLLSVNALNACTEVFIALQSHPFAFDGLHLLMETIQLVKEELNPRLDVTGVVVTMYDHRTKISREIVERAQDMQELEGKLFRTVIRQNIKLTEASKVRKPVMDFDEVCTGTQDYLGLCREICAQHAPSKASGAKSNSQQPTHG
jgi:chromosome partitioning protein